METYFFKSIACLFAFWAFYKLFLENQSNHLFKRWFLLVSVVLSFVIPALVFTEYVMYTPQAHTNIQAFGNELPVQEQATAVQVTDMDTVNWQQLLLSIYALGFVIFGFRFLKNLVQIIHRIRWNTKIKDDTGTKVLLKNVLPPHTFFSYIFLNKKKFEEKSIPKEVLLHEEVHAKQWHSIDVVFIELLQVLFWFHPMIYLLKNAIKLNHEFLADSAVIKKTRAPKAYQNTLLSYLSRESENKYQSIKMANAINYSSIKKRFNIMKKQSSKKAVFLRSILVLPLCALLLFGFSETKLVPIIDQKNLEIPIESTGFDLDIYNALAKKYNAIPIAQRKIPLEDLRILEKQYATFTPSEKALAEPFPECLPQNIGAKEFILVIVDSQIVLNDEQVPLTNFAKTVDALTQDWEETDYTSIPVRANFSNTPMAFLDKVEAEFQKTHFSKSNEGMRIFPKGYQNQGKQEGASRKLMAEYNALARKYNEMDRDHMRISGKEVERLNYIYDLMSEKQKADAEPFPDFPEPPAPPAPPAGLKYPVAPMGKTGAEAPAFPKANAPSKQKRSKGIPQPPKPPKPIAPVDHIIAMAKKNATFYYEDKEISSDRAIELIKTNEHLNISTTGSRSKKPKVKITKAPVRIKKSSAATGLETGNTTVSGKTLFYTKRNGTVTYFNEAGEQVSSQGTSLLSPQKTKPSFYFNGAKITSAKAHELMRLNTSIQVATEDRTEGEYAVVLTDLNDAAYADAYNNNNTNAFIDLTEMIAKGAKFYYNDAPITTKKAVWLTKNVAIERVNTIGSKEGTPKVYLWKKV